MQSRFIIYLPSDTREATAASLTKVAGIPLFLRSVLELANKGEKSFTIIAPASHRRHIHKCWQKIIKKRDLHLNLLLTKAGNRLDANEVLELKGYVEDNAYFINAAYVLPNLGGFAHEKLRMNINQGEIRLFKPSTKKFAIVGINASAFEVMLAKVQDRPASIEACLNELLNKKSPNYMNEGDEGLVVQKFSDIPIAEGMLAEHIRSNTPSWVAREINKRISLPFSLILARMRISPNTITVFNILIGLCAGIGAASITYTGVLVGGILFQVASIVDGCDGEVAKLTFRTSKFGQYIDSISDNLSLAAFLAGMMIHQYRLSDGYGAFIWGGALLLGAGTLIAIMAEYLKKKTDSASLVTFDKQFLQKLDPSTTPLFVLFMIKHFKMFFKKDLFSLMFLGFAILGILHWWFYFIVIAIWVAVSILFYLRSRGYE